jgi:acyl carrier protein
MGRTLAAHFAAACQARLALTGRTKLPERSQWSAWLEQHPGDNRTGRLIRDIQHWESLGAEVLYLQADSGSRMEMEQAIAAIHQTFGPLHGVVHAAGFYEGSLIQLKQTDGEDRVLTPKVEGTLILDSLLAGEQLDFFVLASSIDALSPRQGSVDYSAANAFLDAFAASRHSRGIFTSVNWDVWNEVGMAAERKVSTAEAQAWEIHLQSGIRPQEGVDAFLRLLDVKLPQIAVITKPILNFRASDEQQLRARAEVLWSKQEETLPETPPSGGTRPDLTSSFASPENEVQMKMLAIWQEMLGVGGMGIDDNFFELGGHSLLATGVLARIRSAFGISIPLRSIFEAPTVRTLSQLVAPMVKKESSASTAESEEREEFEL